MCVGLSVRRPCVTAITREGSNGFSWLMVRLNRCSFLMSHFFCEIGQCKARGVVKPRVIEGLAKIDKKSIFSGKISSLIHSKHPRRVYFM